MEEFKKRSGGKCELCQSADNLDAHIVGPGDANLWLCQVCRGQIQHPSTMEASHWHCLNESMWSEVSAVKVMAWRLLKRLGKKESWAQELFEQLYLEESELASAQSGEDEDAGADDSAGSMAVCKDSHGTVLLEGDSVTLIKDLDVKGANFTAKRGTTVKNISLTSNPEHIEGRVNGTQIVLLTKFLKKA